MASSAIPFDLTLLTDRGIPLRRFDAGERIFLENDHGDCMYVILTGSVDVITFGLVLDTVRAGGVFGEMAVIDDGPRSAAALAKEPTEVAIIDKPAFVAIVRDSPEFALQIMQLLSARLRRVGRARKA